MQKITLLLFLLLSSLSGFSQINPENITIIRDQWGVPHIYGNTDAETAYGLAWANAEDDFEDMQKNMLMARGLLGKEMGKEGALIDFAVQLIRARELVESKYESDLSPEFRKVIDGYCQAVNTYAETHPEEVLQKGVFPVDGVDVVIGYVMSFTLIQGVGAHLVNIIEGRPGAPTPHSLRGSNGFALNSHATENGEVFLANNSHQPLEGPSSWYEAHIVSNEGLNTLGGLFPGGLSVFAGCNPDIAWMHTVNFPDFTDVYELEMNPKKKLEYNMDGEWLKLEKRKAKLRVKVGPIVLPLSKKIYWSEYGPTIKKKGKFYSLTFGAIKDIRAAEQWHRMCKARNFTAFKSAVEMQGFPGLNVIYADKNDTIWYLDNGIFPKRSDEYNWVGLLPGNTKNTLWGDQYHSVEDLAQSLNPDCGYVYNTNQSPFICTAPEDRPAPESVPADIGYMQINNNRGIRFQELMNKEDKVSWERFKEIKFDRTYPSDIYLYFIENIEDMFKLSPQKYPDISAGINILKNWDRSADPESQGAALFLASFTYLSEKAAEEHLYFTRQAWAEEEFVRAIDHGTEHLLKHFGTLNVTLGELQRHVRGDKDWPMGGLPDVIAATNAKRWKKGRFKGWLGDSYIQMIRFTQNGVEIETVNCFGASNKPESPHYDDQVPMFLNQELKKMSLDKEEILKNAERVYHPGEE